MSNFEFYTAPEVCIELSARLKQQHLLKSLSQEDLAHKVNLGMSMVQRFERGNGGALENFIRLIIALGLTGQIGSLLLPVKNNLDDVIKIQ